MYLYMHVLVIISQKTIASLAGFVTHFFMPSTNFAGSDGQVGAKPLILMSSLVKLFFTAKL